MKLIIGCLILIALCVGVLICAACIYLVILLVRQIKEEIEEIKGD